MENFTQTCRFILSCNYSSKIIDPIQSRCAIFRFKPLDKKEVFKLVDVIAKSETIRVDDDAKEALYAISEGDCRRMENILQSCAAVDRHVKEETVYSLASFARPQEVKRLLELALAGNFVESRNLLLEVMLNYGLSGLDVIKQVQKEIWGLNLENKKKMMLTEKCGETEFHIVEGSDEFLQLEAYLASVSLVGQS
jgi:replication factor C small subunit